MIVKPIHQHYAQAKTNMIFLCKNDVGENHMKPHFKQVLLFVSTFPLTNFFQNFYFNFSSVPEQQPKVVKWM